MEVGPIRPPSEAASLLVLVDRNCAWNRCAFCPVYKQTEYSARPAEQVLEEVRAAAAAAATLLERAGRDTPPLTHAEARAALGAGPSGDLELRLTHWLMRGGTGIFLQDADPLRDRPAFLAELLEELRRAFPWVASITTYARTSTLRRLGRSGLTALTRSGLTRVHCGVESGDDEVLRFQRKGASFQVHLEGLEATRAAGLEVCAYLMPGLGGKERSRQHAEASARLIARALPDVVRLRSLFIVAGTVLDQERREGRFTPLDEEEMVAEILYFLESMGPLPIALHSDHMLNLFPELAGRLDQEFEAMTALLKDFLAWSPAERAAVIEARRRHHPRHL